ncbi:MAG: hypothetical protein Q4B51_03280 [Coriobacteriaceae bacterium]|nr:hypothetical protein [Coriobacteriaceae bacterium]
MRLPDKVTPYALSSLPLFVAIAKTLEAKDLEPSELISKMVKKSHGLNETMEALDLLFALGKIEFTEDEMRIRYVG